MADDKRIKAIYALFESEIEEKQLEYSERFKSELDHRIAYYQSGGKMVSPGEMKSKIKAVQNKRKR